MDRLHGHPAGALTDRLVPFVAVALVVWAVVLAHQREGALALDDGWRVFGLLNAMISGTTPTAARESSPPTGNATG